MDAIRTTATALADLLECENAALRRLDLPEATSMLDAKRAALAAFQSATRMEIMGAVSDQAMRNLALRLQDTALENKRLLERAMAAQQHIMSLLAQAARLAGPSKGYGALGAYAGPAAGAFALSARA